MKVLLRPNLAWLVCLCVLVCSPLLFSQSAGKISKIEIKHVGPPATSDAMIKANIRVNEGDDYQRNRIDDDVRNLYATGYFYNVRVTENRTSGGVELTYIVQGNPTLTDIKFTGNKKFSNRRLLGKTVTTGPGEAATGITFNTSKTSLEKLIGKPINEKELFFFARKIEQIYQKAGYQKTTVKPVLSIDENAGRGTVTFEVAEAPKVKIKDIVFENASAFPQKKLRKQLKTKRRWWMSWLTGSGVLKDEQFEDDKERLIEFYQNEGYIDFEIKEVKYDYVDPKWMVIRFIVSEGRRYKVGTINFKGNTLFPTNEIVKGITVLGKPDYMKMREGDIFTPKGLTQDVEAVTDFYGSKGYVDTRVNAIKSANTIAGTMDLTFDIQESKKAYIERIDIKGNEKTKDKVIRRELAIFPGEVYDTTRVKLSKERLEGLNYFEKVETRPEATDIPDRKNLVIGVNEKNTGNFMIGAGFSSVDAIVGFVEVTQANFDLFKPPTFTGAGQKFRLRAQLGSKRADYQISFVEPWFLDRKLAFGVDLYHRELNFVSREDLYDETHTGGSLSLTRALGSDFLIGKVSYTLENVDIDVTDDFTKLVSPTIRAEEGSRLVSKIGTSLAYDTRNSSLLPSRGQRTELLTEFAGLGGDTYFYKIEGKTAWYFPGFAEGHILELTARAGVVDSYRSSGVPLFDRWFLGGLYSLRGYRYREVGPVDIYGEPIGGNTYLFGSAEYSIPIIDRLRFAVFYDVGNVYPNEYSLDAGKNTSLTGASYDRKFINDNDGVGIRLNLPIGPLRLDYGYPIQHDKNTSNSGRFQFGVGYTREF